ncbi:PREDICTED: probable serine/threonine-protein kinase yakA [Dufourea novaeangliae]|uniref:Uncharacterized protein n=1 Tax=Dufourea novaeangliae TaxID=178035 RepID=A0A154PEC0_DUFNO|nr:PREDICTED: probable serine/threonine-protein kinase yakA [Dufourea novaeangliae]KZC10181.1 hypothetical protein WN55_01164 [Dufourea novaeangliae]
MTTTTGEPSTLKTPASLSGGDLVSRLLAATPPYLYNVPLTPHSFFFSEMLRSFVQAKAEASSVGTTSSSAPRRRKRSWRDARDRPLELTTKERQLHHHHHHHQQQQQQQQQQEKYFHAQQSQQTETRLENRSKPTDAYDPESKMAAFEQKPTFAGDILKSTDDTKSDFSKHTKNYFDERPRHFEPSQPPENMFATELQKVKPEETHSVDRKTCSYTDRGPYDERTKNSIGNQELPMLPDQKKLDFSRNFLPGLPARGCDMLQGVKGFGLPGNVSNPEFLPNPLWYPPYPMPQSYPGIDPLHFFIDLRVSGHIWDRKLSERQLPFKGKHCSAFSVPQSKEYSSNRPLNLTRDEAGTSRSNEENSHGTNYILRHLTRTYRNINQTQKVSRSGTSTEETEESSKEVDNTDRFPKPETPGATSSSQEEGRKDLRALIGLELVVDYVKEPKGDPSNEQTSQVTE